MTVVAAALLVGGVIFLTAGTVGFLRLPDFFTRMHAIGKADTLGALLSFLGLACLTGWSLVALKLAAIGFFIFVANPTATHAISRAGIIAGLVPWTKGSET